MDLNYMTGCFKDLARDKMAFAIYFYAADVDDIKS